MQTVILLTKAALKKAAEIYQPYAVQPAPQYTLFQAKKPGVTITAYKSGKVMFQGTNCDSEAAIWANNIDHSATAEMNTTTQSPSNTGTKKSKHNESVLPAGFKDWGVIGSDEVGAGAYFGPLTTAAVYVSRDQVPKLRAMGFADSKTLTDDKIVQLAPYIIENLPYHIVNLTPDFYNKKQASGQNVVAMKALSHNFAHNKVIAKLNGEQPDGMLIDQFVQESSYYRYLQKNRQVKAPVKAYFKTKGEQQHVAVAAASVLARYVELQTMEQLSKEAGVKLPIGAGKEADRVAAKLMREGKDLGHFAKLHFANTKKAKKLL
ncbi:ribonuclease HIII [Fructobacillus sp. M2-14]|uniref:Ribonuclease HIII n=1 Tax=Fructobacillus broussonetiae TaxID=2713173 RepID=A0ABS5R301_9LACO|nr:ribonuclease HIII [Fructobacillus broussonetiae]MBS9338939.1 ribonuclease HIII [Fructobacillus broussonetiae]